MIINGASRSNGKFFAQHLLRADHNERVQLVEVRGLGAENVPDAFREMKVLAAGTNCKNYFYHANMNTRADERLTPEQWAQATDMLEHQLGLNDQPRFIVEHEKDGRTHRHVIWSRIDSDAGTTIHDSHNYRRHELAARQIEQAYGLAEVKSTLTRDKETTPRVERRPKDWETFRAAESKIDPRAIKAEITELWRHADSGPAFAAALAERGYILAKGDRRDFCIVDPAGDEHSLARRISGVKAAEIRARLAEVDRDALPSVEEARRLVRERRDQAGGSAPAGALSGFDAVAAETVREAQAARDYIELHAEPVAFEPQPDAPSVFDVILADTVARAAEEIVRAAIEERAGMGRGIEWFRAWCGQMWEHLAGWGEAVQDYFRISLRRADETPERLLDKAREQDTEPQR